MLDEEHKSSLMSHGLQCRLNTTCEENTDLQLFFKSNVSLFLIRFNFFCTCHVNKEADRLLRKKKTSSVVHKSNTAQSVSAWFLEAHLHTNSCCGFDRRPQCSVRVGWLSSFRCFVHADNQVTWEC